MAERIATLFLSDLHIGASRQAFQGDELLACLTAYEPETLIINGDFLGTANIDPADPYYKNAIFRYFWPFTWAPACTRIMARFVELAEQGTHISIIPGNHDHQMEAQAAQGVTFFAMSGIFSAFKIPLPCAAEKLDSTFHIAPREMIHTTRNGFRIWLEHGHAYAEIRPDAPLVYPLAAYVLSGQRQAGLLKYLYLYHRNHVHTQAATRAYQEGAQACMTGHFHAPDARKVMVNKAPILYINTGDWLGNATAVIEKENGDLSMIRYGKKETLEVPLSLS
jgi:UDP-2,3-diacylglucosamine pyrophosphatase LpxH